MAPRLRWQGRIGRDTIKKCVKKCVPQWKNGLRSIQEDLVCIVLDSEDILCCAATGDGKSAAFSIPIIVLNEYNAHRELYPPGLPTRLNPVGIVVTPTKGLASNIVLELTRLGISALAYSRESLADARHRGINLGKEISSCEKYQVICVDPEHLRSKDWRDISEAPAFRAQLLFGASDEIHLINEWGLDFRKDFNYIGPFFRGRLPATTSILGLTATLAPGKDTTAVCNSMGFFPGHFHLIRNTNERLNIQFSMQVLSHGLSNWEFPDLLPYLRSGRKIVIHVSDLDIMFRCYVYIWGLQSASADKMRRTRMYSSLCTPEYNEDTIRRLDEDPQCQIVIATIAFSNGINAKTLLDSISMGFSATVDIMWQEKGRAGREAGTQARGVVLVQQSSVTLARKFMKSLSAPGLPPKKKGKGSKPKSNAMNLLKAQFILEEKCYISFLNRHYSNPPLETSTLDCIAAKRTLPCSLCLARTERTLTFPAPPSTPNFPALKPIPVARKSTASTPKRLKLTVKEQDTATKSLKKFRSQLRQQEHKAGRFLEHPEIVFLPPSIHAILLTNILSITSLSELQSTIPTWRHRELHSAPLFDAIVKVQSEILKKRDLTRKIRNSAARQQAAKRKADALEESSTDSESEHSDPDSDPVFPETVPLPPKKSSTRHGRVSTSTGSRKRQTLEVVTNLDSTHRIRSGKTQPSAAEVAKDYGRAYKPRERTIRR
ncbi:hypothetical protein C8R43DRAFT_1168127 [Mycena crocata]|nr:hypothetical protein C8R43DRAFT_1168127 [Mycena crocata]